MMKRMIRILVILAICLLAWGVLDGMAQPGDPGEDPFEPQPIPLGGIEWLLLAGGAFGVKKYLSKKNKGE